MSVGYFFTPASTNVDFVSLHLCSHCSERTLSVTTSAMVTLTRIQMQLSVFHLRHTDWTVVFYLADLTSTAFLQIHRRHSLSNDTKVIQIRLYTVVRTAAHRNLKLMW